MRHPQARSESHDQGHALESGELLHALYELRNQGLISKVSEIDSIRQFTTNARSPKWSSRSSPEGENHEVHRDRKPSVRSSRFPAGDIYMAFWALTVSSTALPRSCIRPRPPTAIPSQTCQCKPGILDAIPDDEFKLLAENEASALNHGRPRGQGLRAVPTRESPAGHPCPANLEMLFAYHIELNLLRTMAADEDRVLLLLPGRRSAAGSSCFMKWRKATTRFPRT